MKDALTSKLFLLFFVIVSGALALGQLPVYADAPAERPVTVTPLCSDATQGTAQWRIGNPNPGDVSVDWVVTGTTGTASMPYGYMTVTTPYDTTEDTPSVTFQQDGLPDQIATVSALPCAPKIEGCVDGYVRDNLQLDGSRTGKVTITTTNGAPLCDDVTVYFTSYTLPATYDESGIFDDSAIPQTAFASTSAVLAKGTTGGVTLNVAVPNACTDYQLDVYYAPEILSVSYNGQGAQLIYGDIYLHTSTNCVVAPPAGQVQGVSTVTPAKATLPELANTGQSAVLPSLAALVIALSAAAVNFPILPRLKRIFAK